MSVPSQRDQAIDRMLRRGAARPGAGPGCPEPEILAAYFDRSLSADETSAWEGHFADCALCQSQLAVLARTAEHPQPQRAWMLFPIFEALVPLAAAVLMVIVLVRTPRLQNVARLGASNPRVETPSSAGGAPPVLSGQYRPVPEPGKPVAQGRVAPSPGKPSQSTPAPSGSTGTDQTLQANAEQKKESTPIVTATAQPPASPEGSGTPGVGISRGAGPPPRTIGAFGGVSAAKGLSGAASVIVRPPGGPAAWRIWGVGTIEFSSDGGKTWKRQYAGREALLAGAAPSVNVCWVVGKAGAVLRTLDGRRWELVHAPAMADLVSVAATDADHATVKTSDGATYVTSDGGKTWKKE